MSVQMAHKILVDPKGTARQCVEEQDLKQVVLTALWLTTLGTAVFGAVIGGFRGGIQIAYSAIKLPLAMLITLAFCVPAFQGINAALGKPMPLRSMVALSLSAMSRASLALIALSPVAWLAVDYGLSYHLVVSLASLLYGGAGLAALAVLLRGLAPGAWRPLIALGIVVVFFGVGGQTAWMLRPFLGRPAQAEVPFVRAREKSFADAILTSGHSATRFGAFRDRAREGTGTPGEKESRARADLPVKEGDFLEPTHHP